MTDELAVNATYVPGELCAEHPDHFMPCSKCAGADCCDVPARMHPEGCANEPA